MLTLFTAHATLRPLRPHQRRRNLRRRLGADERRARRLRLRREHTLKDALVLTGNGAGSATHRNERKQARNLGHANTVHGRFNGTSERAIAPEMATGALYVKTEQVYENQSGHMHRWRGYNHENHPERRGDLGRLRENRSRRYRALERRAAMLWTTCTTH